ncbi:MAG: hypothetical protein AAFV33_07880 [Chloroflexota bacterium]
MRVIRPALLMLAMLLLAACGGQNNAGGGGVSNGRSGTEDINWNSDASHIVFQIDVVGGGDAIDQRNDIALCTIYGDNRIVWTPDSQPGQRIVLFDYLETITVGDFILDLIINFDIYEYGAQAAVQLPGDETPVYEQIVVGVNDRVHITDGFEEWPTDFFRDILDRCRNLSTRPVTVAPEGGWLTAEFANFDPTATIITWNAEASGIDLLLLADADEDVRRLWVDNDVLPILWNVMVNSPRSRLFEQGDDYFRIGFEVPNLTRDAPPAPATEEELIEARSLEPEAEEE